MGRGLAGFTGGVIGGLIKLLIDQIGFAINISTADTAGTVSQVLYGVVDKPPIISWSIYILGTGIVGWIISRIISKEYTANYFSSGIITGVSLWIIMNIIFAFSGILIPTWSMGVGTFIVNLFSHIVLGLVIMYTVSRTQVKETD